MFVCVFLCVCFLLFGVFIVLCASLGCSRVCVGLCVFYMLLVYSCVRFVLLRFCMFAYVYGFSFCLSCFVMCLVMRCLFVVCCVCCVFVVSC